MLHDIAWVNNDVIVDARAGHGRIDYSTSALFGRIQAKCRVGQGVFEMRYTYAAASLQMLLLAQLAEHFSERR